MSDKLEWESQGACRTLGPGLFFSSDPEDIARAKSVCRGCPVRVHCAEYALVAGETEGVWGGMEEKERKSFIRKTKFRSAWSPKAHAALHTNLRAG